MLCNWNIAYEPATVNIDPEYGEEPGARYRLTSDWDDDFVVLCCPGLSRGYSSISQWCRALDEGVVPDYFLDTLPDLTAFVIDTGNSGNQAYQTDLATRQGNETARQRWIDENT